MRTLGLDHQEVLRKPDFNDVVASQLTFLKEELRKTKALSDELVPMMLVNYCGAPNNA
ncbi:hypothetical protein JCM19233_7292 [Vibrio astriarenae]|nr:hypothetical protein JCM19233_7292 [Vibrio sp. C7]